MLDSREKERAWLKPAKPELEIATSGSRKTRRRTRTIPAALRFEVLRRHGFSCTYCAAGGPLR